MKLALSIPLTAILSSCAFFQSEKVSFSGGTGLSIENAIIVKAPNEEAGVQAERDYFETHYPHYYKGGQNLVEYKGKSIDAITLIYLGKKPNVTLYFNIASFYGK